MVLPERPKPRSTPSPRTPRLSRRAAYALILAGAVLWGLSGIFTKGLLDAGLGAFEIAFWRMLLGGGLFLGHAVRRRDLKLASRSDLGALALFALVAIALHYAMFNFAIERGGVSLVNLFLASVPLLVALGAWLFLRERLTSWTLALGAISALGLTLVAGGGGHGVEVNLVSVGAALVVALTVVAYTVLGKDLLRRYSPVTLNAFVMPLGALMLLPFVSFGAKTPEAWLLLGVLTVFPTYGAHLFYQLGLQHVEASRVALLVNVETVTALATAALLFGERLTAQGVLGVVLILAVSVLVALPQPPVVGRRAPRPGLAES